MFEMIVNEEIFES